MSSSLLKPSVTPRMALLASARARPCSARSRPSSPCREASSSPFSSLKLMPGGTGVVSLPLGPCTSRRSGLTWTCTPLGLGMTLRPTRDSGPRSLPDVAEDLATHALAGRAAPRPQAARGGEDVDAQAAAPAGDLVLAAVDPAPGLAHPLQVGDDPLHAGSVFQDDAEHP